MKNIYLVPTDNYSQLVHSTSRYGGLFLSKYYSPMKEMGDSYQNIHITSDEEKPKAGEWSLYQNKIHKCIEDIIGDEFKKIILTTDQDLIKDGVQAIDDGFLEWFVKNPSCESVEVKKFFGFAEDYLITIPQEEPKQQKPEETDEITFANEIGQTSDYDKGRWYGRIEGANWQQKRMYSEEEVLEILFKSHNAENTSIVANTIMKWFEQFKKK
jgi:hypothetical protein